MKLRILVAAIAVAGCAGGLNAAIFNIASGDVPGLITAINTCNTNGQDDTINLVTNSSYLFTTVDNTTNGNNWLPVIQSDNGHSLTITGSEFTTMKPGPAASGSARLLQIAANASVTVNGIVLQGGGITPTSLVVAEGGGILNFGTLTLTECWIVANNVTGFNNSSGPGGAVQGGGISNHGTLSISRCTVGANTTTGGSGSTASGGSALGAGLFNQGTAVLLNCTFGNNKAIGGQSGSGNGGEASGGSVYVGQGTVSAVNCTIGRSDASGGSGNGGNGPGRGGGVFIDNTTGAFFPFNTIVGSNTASGGPGSGELDVFGTVSSQGHNMVSVVGNSNGWIGSDLLNVDPKITTGATFPEGFGFFPNSPAIDAADDSVLGPPFSLTTDEPGVPRKIGAHVDIGAIEVEPRQSGPDYQVTTIDDHRIGGCGVVDCSLREAMEDAANHNGSHTITFAPGVTGMIQLTKALQIISNNVTITGPGLHNLTVRRNTGGDYRIFTVSNGFSPGPTVAISGLTLSNGKAPLPSPSPSPAKGGGILNDHGTLTLTDVGVVGNTATNGGGIVNNHGTLTLTRCVITDNSANNGAGIQNDGSVSGSASATLRDCTLRNNITGQFGGAIFSSGTNGGQATLAITNCTIADNSASRGAAFYNTGASGNAAVSVLNSTISGNSASFLGGTFNTGSSGTATVTTANSVYKTGASGANFVSTSASIVSQGHNISNDAAGGDGTTSPDGFLNGTGDKRNTDPLLDAAGVKNNGGYTDTIALLMGSPAINAGDNALAPATDQRGYFRNGVSDIGAFEFNGIPPPPPSVTTAPATNITTTSATLNATVNPNGFSTSVQFTTDFGFSAALDAGSGTAAVPFAINVSGLSPGTQYQFDVAATSTGGTVQGIQQAFTTVAAPSPSPTATPTATPIETPTATPSATPIATPTPVTTLANISTRLRVETGDNVLIGGFIITGTQDKKVIVRGIGTSLSLADKLADPTLELHGPNGLIDSNDNWVDSPNKQAIIDSTIPPTSDLESAIVQTLPAGSTGYTAIVRGANNTTGIGVVEAYDLDTTVDSKLANISTRGFVQTGDNVLIAGTIIVGQAPQKVIIRAIGPSLQIAGKLADPTLELRDSNGALIQSNDNWVDSPNKQAIIDSTIPPTNDLESAIVAILPANTASYTAIVRGVNDTTGIAVVEVYALN